VHDYGRGAQLAAEDSASSLATERGTKTVDSPKTGDTIQSILHYTVMDPRNYKTTLVEQYYACGLSTRIVVEVGVRLHQEGVLTLDFWLVWLGEPSQAVIGKKGDLGTF
jgi:hypothetical protein